MLHGGTKPPSSFDYGTYPYLIKYDFYIVSKEKTDTNIAFISRVYALKGTVYITYRKCHFNLFFHLTW